MGLGLGVSVLDTLGCLDMLGYVGGVRYVGDVGGVRCSNLA